MFMRRIPSLLWIAALFAFAVGEGSAFRLSPFRSKFEPSGPESNQLFLVENNTGAPASVQIRIADRQIDVDGGETIRDNEKDFTIYPAQMILQSNSNRSVSRPMDRRSESQGGKGLPHHCRTVAGESQ
jgi:P pilus assembly chaperone PapD